MASSLMPMYLLDTNIISYWMRGDQHVIEKLKSCRPAELSLSTITLAEIYYGIEKSPVKKKNAEIKLSELNLRSTFILSMNMLWESMAL